MTHHNKYRHIGMRVLAAGALGAAVAGCIKNDIPYPRIQPNITSIEAPGLTKPAEIDSANRLVVMTFDESVDIYHVPITSYTLSEGSQVVSGDLNHPIDLSRYYIVTLRLYQDYDWVIQGNQTIDRYFTVDNQVGATVIDVTGHRVVVTVTENSGLDNVKVLTMKLGPEGCTQVPDIAGQTISLKRPYEVVVTAFGRAETWTIYGETVESTVQTIKADPWSQVAWVYGSAVAGKDNGVEYRQQGMEEWQRAPQDMITHTGGTFYACLNHLEPETTYEARAYSNEELGNIVTFTTGSILQLPNSSLSEWSKDGKVWNPWPEGGTPFWDTGNKGAATLGESNSIPTDDTSSGTGQAAKLMTKFIGIGMIGKLGAGNIFVGSYVRTDGTNGVLSFGRPYTQRPTRVRGYLKYDCTPISHANAEMADLKGRPDTGIVWCALIDTPEPLEIRTNPNNRNLFDPNASYVIAYGAFQTGQTIPQYIPFEFTLDYNSTSRVPTYILLAASASKYGDYFTGGAGSTMYIDDIELLYDY